MPEVTYKPGDKVRCKCGEHCEEILIILDYVGQFNDDKAYLVKHDGKIPWGEHYVFEDMIEAIK